MEPLIKCPKCGKEAKIQAQFPLGNLINYVYQCGHLELRKKIEEVKNEKIPDATMFNSETQVPISFNQNNSMESYLPTHGETSKYEFNENVASWLNWVGLKNYKPIIHDSFYSLDKEECSYPYQIEGVTFAESTGLNCLFADGMGVGKTIEALVTLKRNNLYPCLILVKGSVFFQWVFQFHKWVSTKLEDCIPVTKRSHLITGFKVYILSMDMLPRKGIVETLLTLGLKSIIIDEVQNFKNGSTGRTEALLKLIKLGNINHTLSLSGTPIKNRTSEYKTVLVDLLHLFNNEKHFYGYLEGDGLKPELVDSFKSIIKSKVIRREKHEVLKDLPALTRDYQLIEIDDPNIRASYNRTLDLFSNFLNDDKTGITSQQLLGWLSQLRSITGKAKCKNAIEWTTDFLESTDESLAIGIHHETVRDTLYLIFKQFGLNPLKLSGEDNMYRKADIVRNFTNGHNRLLVINSLAGGVGLNLQTCANALVLERQWNSADEEQFEARFHRNGQHKAVTVTYMIAKGTIDEFFHERSLSTRKILSSVGLGVAPNMEDSLQSLLDFANIVVGHKI